MLEPLLTWATPGKRGFTDAMRLQSGIVLTQTPSYSAGLSAGPSYASGSANNPMYINDRTSSQSSSQSSQTQLANQRALEVMEAQRRAEELRVMLAGLEKVDDEGRRSNFLDALYGQENQDILNLPEHPSPPGKEEGSLTVDLLKHQVCHCVNRFPMRRPTKALVETRSVVVYQPRVGQSPSKGWRATPTILGVSLSSGQQGTFIFYGGQTATHKSL
jgi:hypothetical protein